MRRSDLTGQVLDGRYRVIEPIGKGAMGDVYRGERLKLGRTVAIKVMNEEIPNESSRKRFEREAMAMAKLEHPHCASVLDVGVHDGQPYVVMEFVSGKNLKELLAGGALPVARAVEIVRQVLSGLTHAHEHGIIHRDIKPANIVLSQKSGLGDHVQILDFGLARFNQDTSNLTTGLVLGTPNYMAPEQISGSAIDHRVDLYACGVLLFELLTATKPFEAKDPVAVCMRHLNEPAPKLADKSRDRALAPFEPVVARALAKEPDQRFANAEEFSRALIAATKPAEPAAAKPAARPSRRLLGVAAGGVLVGVAAIAIAVTSHHTHTSSAPMSASPGKPSRPDEAPRPAAPSNSDEAARPPASSDSDEAPRSARPKESPTATPEPSETSGAASSIEGVIARAKGLADAGRRESAIDVLVKARKTYPSDARLPYQAAKLYLEKSWWPDGLKYARAALALDPKLKSDPDLIRLVLRGFNSTRQYDGTLARFLREDIGDAAKPFIADTAEHHPNPIVRARASDELRRYR